MPPVYHKPEDTPCVRCAATPTMGYCHAGVEGISGRVCVKHAGELADQGHCVVSDGKVVENWGGR
jgi:hypothetical protein